MPPWPWRRLHDAILSSRGGWPRSGSLRWRFTFVREEYWRPWAAADGVRVEIGADAAMAKARAARCHPLPCGGWFVRQPAGYAIGRRCE